MTNIEYMKTQSDFEWKNIFNSTDTVGLNLNKLKGRLTAKISIKPVSFRFTISDGYYTYDM